MPFDVEEAYRRYFPVIRAKCARMLRDPSEAHDLAQETFTRLWMRKETLRDPEAVLSWVYRTSTRLAVDRLRRREATAGTTEHALLGASPDPQIEARDTLRVLFQRLKTRELEVLLLTRGDGLTQSEVAQVLNLSERTVRRILERVDGQVGRMKERL